MKTIQKVKTADGQVDVSAKKCIGNSYQLVNILFCINAINYSRLSLFTGCNRLFKKTGGLNCALKYLPTHTRLTTYPSAAQRRQDSNAGTTPQGLLANIFNPYVAPAPVRAMFVATPYQWTCAAAAGKIQPDAALYRVSAVHGNSRVPL